MTVRTDTPCTFCHGQLIFTVGQETIICPAHRELHDAQGRPTFTVDQVASGDITIGPTKWPLSFRLLIVVGSLTLWGLIVLTVMNPAAGLLVAATVAVLIVAIYDTDDLT